MLTKLKSYVAGGVVFVFLTNSLVMPLPAHAQELYLPAPGIMVHLSPEFNPPILKGIRVYTDNPFKFDFILDKGDSRLSNDALKEESSDLIKYFLASLTIPEKDLWVNLSPYEKNRIVPNSFGLTEMGCDLLAEDYMLKQITASLIYPEDEIGKKFWKRIYEEAARRFGTTNIPVNTFNKVWIVPEKAVVYENAQAGTAYVVESKLKVMLEEDYLSLEKHTLLSPVILSETKDLKTSNDSSATPQNDVNTLGSQIVREIVIPELTKEVNEDKNFSQLRQVYNSLILATWYKKKIKDSILTQVYSNKNKVAGVNIDDPQEKEKIYQQYLKAFKKGVYNYIKEEQDPVTQETIPKKYFSGGVSFFDDRAMLTVSHDQGRLPGSNAGQLLESIVIQPVQERNNIKEAGPIAHFADTVVLVHPLRHSIHYQLYQRLLEGVTHRIVLTNTKFPFPEVLAKMELQEEDSFMGSFILPHHFGSSAAFIGGHASACLGMAILTSAKVAFLSQDRFQAYVFTEGIWTDFYDAHTLEEDLVKSRAPVDFLKQEFKAGVVRLNERHQILPWKTNIILDVAGHREFLYRDKKSTKELVIKIIRPANYQGSLATEPSDQAMLTWEELLEKYPEEAGHFQELVSQGLFDQQTLLTAQYMNHGKFIPFFEKFERQGLAGVVRQLLEKSPKLRPILNSAFIYMGNQVFIDSLVMLKNNPSLIDYIDTSKGLFDLMKWGREQARGLPEFVLSSSLPSRVNASLGLSDLFQKLGIPSNLIKVSNDNPDLIPVIRQRTEYAVVPSYSKENVVTVLSTQQMITSKDPLEVILPVFPFKANLVYGDNRDSLRSLARIEPGKKVVIFSSFNKDEFLHIRMFQETFQKISQLPLEQRPLVILAPGDVSSEGSNELRAMVEKYHLTYAERTPVDINNVGTAEGLPMGKFDVVTINTKGELARLYALADLVVLNEDQNILEPLMRGAAVLYKEGLWRNNVVGLRFSQLRGVVMPYQSYLDFYPKMIEMLDNDVVLRQKARQTLNDFHQEIIPGAYFIVSLALANALQAWNIRDLAMNSTDTIPVNPIHGTKYRSFEAVFQPFKVGHPGDPLVNPSLWAKPGPSEEISRNYSGFNLKFGEFSRMNNDELAQSVKDLFGKLPGVMDRENYFSLTFNPNRFKKSGDLLKAFVDDISDNMPMYMTAIKRLYVPESENQGVLDREDVQKYLAVLKTVVDRWTGGDGPIELSGLVPAESLVQNILPAGKPKVVRHQRNGANRKLISRQGLRDSVALKGPILMKTAKAPVPEELLNLIYDDTPKLASKVLGLIRKDIPDLEIVDIKAIKLNMATILFSGDREITFNVKYGPKRVEITAGGWVNNDDIVRLLRKELGLDPAMLSNPNGGIDFTANKAPLEIQNAGEAIKFKIDPAMLEQLQNAPGFVPVIINIRPMTDLRRFLGLAQDPALN